MSKSREGSRYKKGYDRKMMSEGFKSIDKVKAAVYESEKFK